MRESFDGLHALVRDHLQLDAFAGHLLPVRQQAAEIGSRFCTGVCHECK